MATIWGAPFYISEIRLPLPPPEVVNPVTTAVDKWGMPISNVPISYLDLKIKVKPVKKEAKNQQISLDLSDSAVLFEGNVVTKNPVTGVILPNTKGTGVINGERGEIVIVGVGQSSLKLITDLLGEKIRFEFKKTLANI